MFAVVAVNIFRFKNTIHNYSLSQNLSKKQFLIYSNSEICSLSLRDTSLFEEKGELLTKKRENG
jgi:hypothetical protein